jgi:subtilisin family serine protease
MKRMSWGILLLAVACGKSGGGGEKFGAPADQTQAGIIASCTTKSQAASTAEKLGGSFRVLNEKKGLIEFYDIPSEDLKLELPRAKLKANQVYENLTETGFASVVNLGNFPYVGGVTPQYRDSSMTSYFPYLTQIDAFDLPAGSRGAGVVIAVVDSGVHYNHPHLSPNIRTNSRDGHGPAANGRDEDGNGFSDDFAGWDFYNHDAYPVDDNGHGTHVAGLAAGTLSGVAPEAKILPVKVLGSRGNGDLGTIAAGILYAIENGADVINLSLGGSGAGLIGGALDELVGHIRLANDRNIVIVAAAGNGGTDGVGDCNDDQPVWPASIESDNMIAVASVDASNHLTKYSNFGGRSVHVAAPGGDNVGLLSTVPGNCTTNCNNSHAIYDRMSGTSMASPVVSGLVAVVKGVNRGLAATEVRALIMENGTDVPEFDGLVRSRQVVNASKVLERVR